MRILAKRALREFWLVHADSETSLRAWYGIADKAQWTSPSGMKATFPSASLVGQLTVFNIGGNKYRLVTAINYESHYIFVRAVLTHAEYDRGDWKHGSFNI